jgi:hypothetical protein
MKHKKDHKIIDENPFNIDFKDESKDIDFLETQMDDFVTHNFESGETDQFIKLTNNKITTFEIGYANAVKLAKDIDIKKGETVYANLEGKFVFGDFIGAFIQENHLRVEELTIVSLSGGIDNFAMLSALIEKGWVKKINLILSTYFIKVEMFRNNAMNIACKEFLKNISKKHGDAFNIYYTNVHAKLVLIKTEKGGHVTMHGSSNLRSSQNLEQLIIQENKALYDFNYQFYKSLIPK